MISVGGVSQMLIWDIRLDCKQILTVKQIVNYFIWGPDDKLNSRPWVKKPKQLTDPQVRFMDVGLRRLFKNEFLICTICSDSTLRLFRLSLDRCHIYLISTHSLSNYCPLKMLNHNGLSMITSTDGSLRLIELRLDRLSELNFEDQKLKEPSKAKFTENPLAMVINQSDDHSIEKSSQFLHILHSVELHQFGINSIDYIELNDGKFLVFTAGEDTTLGYMLVKWKDNEKFSNLSNENTMHCPKSDLKIEFKGNCQLGHCSMISKVKVLASNLLATASWDRRIKIWQFELDDKLDNKLQLACKKTVISSISDIAELIVYRHSRDQAQLVVLGNGREVYEIDFTDL